MLHNILFEWQAFDDFVDWQEPLFGRRGIVAPLMTELILRIDQYGNPDTAIPVTYKTEDAWQMKIWGKHNLIYQIDDKTIRILSCRHRRN